MTPDLSFGAWLRRQRRYLDLTQEELANQVGCSPITIRKLEGDERRPSKPLAERLAQVLAIPKAEQPRFFTLARASLTATTPQRPDEELVPNAWASQPQHQM